MWGSVWPGVRWAAELFLRRNWVSPFFLTVSRVAVTIEVPGNPALSRPRRLARPRTSPFHGGNTGSNPVGDANFINHLQIPSRIL